MYTHLEHYGPVFALIKAQDGNLELQEQGPGLIHSKSLSPLVFLKKIGLIEK